MQGLGFPPAHGQWEQDSQEQAEPAPDNLSYLAADLIGGWLPSSAGEGQGNNHSLGCVLGQAVWPAAGEWTKHR